jgi:glyceraldehyde 3-phosphate dehydrogenase
MFVMGVNHTQLTWDEKIFSNASCTTNCLAPLVKILDEAYGIEAAFVSTIHAATSSQSTVDAPRRKWRRGRSALNNIIPTSTLAADALTVIMPAMKGKIYAMAFRVPTVDVSLVDMTFKLKKETSYGAIKELMKLASETNYKGILGYTEDPVVSQDFISETQTSVFDANAGLELNPRFFKIVAWYDNEYGYATKLIDLIEYAYILGAKEQAMI